MQLLPVTKGLPNSTKANYSTTYIGVLVKKIKSQKSIQCENWDSGKMITIVLTQQEQNTENMLALWVAECTL